MKMNQESKQREAQTCPSVAGEVDDWRTRADVVAREVDEVAREVDEVAFACEVDCNALWDDSIRNIVSTQVRGYPLLNLLGYPLLLKVQELDDRIPAYSSCKRHAEWLTVGCVGGGWVAVGRRTYSGRADTGRTRPPTCLWLSPGMR